MLGDHRQRLKLGECGSVEGGEGRHTSACGKRAGAFCRNIPRHCPDALQGCRKSSGTAGGCFAYALAGKQGTRQLTVRDGSNELGLHFEVMKVEDQVEIFQRQLETKEKQT